MHCDIHLIFILAMIQTKPSKFMSESIMCDVAHKISPKRKNKESYHFRKSNFTVPILSFSSQCTILGVGLVLHIVLL